MAKLDPTGKALLETIATLGKHHAAQRDASRVAAETHFASATNGSTQATQKQG